MRILFGNRGDDLEGGDRMKQSKFAEALLACGHEVHSISPKDLVDYNSYDVVHAFNLNWPWSVFFYDVAKRYKKPFFISTIHFDLEAAQKQAQKDMLDYAKGVVMFSKKEKAAIERFLEYEIDPNKCIYLHNGTAQEFSDYKNWEDRKYDFLSVANYVVPRKNLERFARIAKDKGCIVGSPAPNAESYYDQVAKMGPEMVSAGMNHEKLADVYNDAKVVACLGHQDPFPNPVLEGTNCGCNLVVSKNTYVDIDSPHVWYVDPEDDQEIAGAMREALEKQVPRKRRPSYARQAKLLVERYQKCVLPFLL